jgi:DnaJ homolog subfamily A member 2
MAGDVIFVIQEEEHDHFRRKGADLMMDMELELSEALCGFVKTIRHLDGRVLKVVVPAGQVTKHDSYRVINQEGMPVHGNPFVKGGLYIHFLVNFPKKLSPDLVAKLSGVLPSVAKPSLNGEEEDHDLCDVDMSQFGKTTAKQASYEDDDEDDGGHGGQRVQCGQN